MSSSSLPPLFGTGMGTCLGADQQELEKLISYSATPTAVWRRTGEVCYANPEFCSLVKRTEGDLLQGQREGKKQYIYQLFSKPSYVPSHLLISSHTILMVLRRGSDQAGSQHIGKTFRITHLKIRLKTSFNLPAYSSVMGRQIVRAVILFDGMWVTFTSGLVWS